MDTQATRNDAPDLLRRDRARGSGRRGRRRGLRGFNAHRATVAFWHQPPACGDPFSSVGAVASAGAGFGAAQPATSRLRQRRHNFDRLTKRTRHFASVASSWMSAGGAGSEAALPRLPAHRRMETWQVRPARASAGQGARPTSPRQRRRHPQAHTRHLPASPRRRRDAALLAMPKAHQPDRLAPRPRRRRPLDLPRPRVPELQPQRSRASERQVPKSYIRAAQAVLPTP